MGPNEIEIDFNAIKVYLVKNGFPLQSFPFTFTELLPKLLPKLCDRHTFAVWHHHKIRQNNMEDKKMMVFCTKLKFVGETSTTQFTNSNQLKLILLLH